MLPFVLFLGLAACDTEGPGFSRSDKVIVTEAGSRFTLRRNGDVVEAIRTSPEMLPKFQDIAPKAGLAAQKQTGCRADWVMGDPAMMWVGLACEGRKPPKIPRRNQTAVCELTYQSGGEVEYTCGRR